MKGHFAKTAVLSLLSLFLAPHSLHAWNYWQEDGYPASTTEQSVQLRVGAQFTKKWKCGIRLSLAEEMRFNLYDSYYGASFSRSYTTLDFAYSPIEYVKLDAGYTLRLYGTKGWNDPNEFLRHRVFFGVQGAYKTGIVKLTLRERALCDIRTDSVNLEEKNRYNWLLRTRVGAEFTVPNRPVKPYLWVELENTLNVPEYQRKNGMQYISHVRAQAGVKWRLTRMSSLDFFYRFQYGYNRDIDINRGYYTDHKTLKIRLTEEISFVHALGIIYNLDW